MNITGKITGIKYKVLCADDLKEVEVKNFDINKMPTSCLLKGGKHSFAISKWLSPKRSRSYPFERVFNTLNISKKITVIPIVKDEGAAGERDFLQWDTVSLMSLLDVFVIFAYYEKADKKGLKLKNQQFNNDYVTSKIKEIAAYHSSALHWNLNELNTNLHNVIEKTKTAYANIEMTTGVKLHNTKGVDDFKTKIGADVSLFMAFSREKAEKAQAREFVTVQPKESLSTLSKAKITITNYLGGQYFLTVDEISVSKNKVSLIEGKHSKKGVLPSKGDIKDGLFKMILYANLSDVAVDGVSMQSQAILSLTSTQLKSEITSSDAKTDIETFFLINKLSKKQIKWLETVFEEANHNNFIVQIKYSV